MRASSAAYEGQRDKLSCFSASWDWPPVARRQWLCLRKEPVFFKINNLEQVNPGNTLSVPGYPLASGLQGNWGVLTVSSSSMVWS
jgi:hypothetical protein